MRNTRSAARLGVSLLLLVPAAHNYARYIDDNRVFARIAAQVCAGRLTERERLEARLPLIRRRPRLQLAWLCFIAGLKLLVIPRMRHGVRLEWFQQQPRHRGPTP